MSEDDIHDSDTADSVRRTVLGTYVFRIVTALRRVVNGKRVKRNCKRGARRIRKLLYAAAPEAFGLLFSPNSPVLTHVVIVRDDTAICVHIDLAFAETTAKEILEEAREVSTYIGSFVLGEYHSVYDEPELPIHWKLHTYTEEEARS